MQLDSSARVEVHGKYPTPLEDIRHRLRPLQDTETLGESLNHSEPYLGSLLLSTQSPLEDIWAVPKG